MHLQEPHDVTGSQLALLYEISRVVSSALDLDNILQILVRLAVSVTECDACLVYLPEPERGELVLRASQLQHSEEIGNLRLKVGEGITGWVLEHRSVVALGRSAYKDERFLRFPTLVEDTFESFLSAPLLSGGEVIGVINIHHREPHQHTPEEVALVMFLGEQMGGAIARARLEDEKQEFQRQLESRKVLERAKGILQRSCNITEEEAYLRLRNESRRTRRPMRELAEAIIVADTISKNAGDTAASA